MENKNNSISENADENFNNDLETISLETETGPMEIKKWDTFKWKSHGAVPFRVARIERINKKLRKGEKGVRYPFLFTKNLLIINQKFYEQI